MYIFYLHLLSLVLDIITAMPIVFDQKLGLCSSKCHSCSNSWHNLYCGNYTAGLLCYNTMYGRKQNLYHGHLLIPFSCELDQRTCQRSTIKNKKVKYTPMPSKCVGWLSIRGDWHSQLLKMYYTFLKILSIARSAQSLCLNVQFVYILAYGELPSHILLKTLWNFSTSSWT